MVAEKVVSVIANIKRIPEEQITIDSTFAELGIDSLDGVEIVCELEERFGIAIPDDIARSMSSVRQVVESLQPLLNGEAVSASAGQG
jgi:acyl carrier protein